MRRSATGRLVPDWNLETTFPFTFALLHSTLTYRDVVAIASQRLRFAPDFGQDKTGDQPMISRRFILPTLAAAAFSAATLPVLAGSRGIDPVRTFDTDNDGTLDLAEVKKAASGLFAKLDRDHDEIGRAHV